ncbi:hypothetical protein [Sphingomonas sp. NPDC079357]|uniref:hypothetical protein n=1 Tax=Sphingomonas sp. NPDC079357 TaxID=3364518 RepID=UPI00384BCFA2
MKFAFLLLAAQVAAPSSGIDGLPIGALPQQALPARGCAAYLFSTGTTRTLAAMATADPGTLRLSVDGKMIDLPRTGATGNAQLGLNAESVYRLGDIVATVQMTVELRQNLTAGAAVPVATLRLDRDGRDTVVVPLAGLVGCAG